MKKILVGFAIFAMSLGAHAATVAWTIDSVTASPSSTTGSISSGEYVAYLFLTSDTTVSSLTTTTYSTVASILASGSTGASWTSLTSLAATSATTMGSGVWVANSLTGGDVSFTYTLENDEYEYLYGFVVVFDSSTIDNASNYLLVNNGDAETLVLSTSINSNTGSGTLAFGDQSSTAWNTLASSNVPEPTSGLLLLVGVAGLALKRKHA